VEQASTWTTSFGSGNNSWSRKLLYDASGLVTDVYDARSVHTTIAYDDLNRPNQISYSDSTPTAYYFYDSQTLPTGHPSYTPANSNGRLIAMTYGDTSSVPNPTGNYLNYDTLGRVTAQWQVTGAGPTAYAMSYAYNYAGMLTGETYPSGRAMSYAYGYGGTLSSVSDGTTTFADTFAYAANGGMNSETFGNGMVHSIDYNHALQASQVKLKQSSSGSELQRYDYQYGEVTQSSGSVDMSKNTGQIARIDATINGSSTKEWDQRFSYDEVGRLSVASEYQNGTGSTPTWQTKYTYDRWGNRMQSGSTNNFGVGFVSVTGSDIDAATNRFITSGTTPTTYDAGGNITQDTKFRNYKYEYDANSRQTAVKLADNTGVQGAVYDCGGQRVQTTANAVTRTMVYDVFGQDVADYSGSSLERENIYRGGQLLATQPFTAARVNVAQADNGATASVTSSLSSSFRPAV
jgi:hypothetical protein